MTGDPCPHGIPKAVRRVDGCRKCDEERREEFLAAQEAARFRVRVIQTARAVLPAVTPAQGDDARLAIVAHAFDLAEAFERAADEYEKGGGK